MEILIQVLSNQQQRGAEEPAQGDRHHELWKASIRHRQNVTAVQSVNVDVLADVSEVWAAIQRNIA